MNADLSLQADMGPSMQGLHADEHEEPSAARHAPEVKGTSGPSKSRSAPCGPKPTDVERQGHYSAGRMRPPKKLKTAKPTVAPSTTYGTDVEGEDPP